MSKTFYIAASSEESPRVAVQHLAKALYQKFGWQWANGYDWTKGFKDEADYPRHELVYRAKSDRAGARDADVFIFLETDTRSLGANREYGVRWGANKLIYRVSEQPDHLFDMLDMMVTVKTTMNLFYVLEAREA